MNPTKPLKSNLSTSALSQPSASRISKDKKIQKKPLIIQPTVINYKEEIKKFEDRQHEYNADA